MLLYVLALVPLLTLLLLTSYLWLSLFSSCFVTSLMMMVSMICSDNSLFFVFALRSLYFMHMVVVAFIGIIIVKCKYL